MSIDKKKGGIDMKTKSWINLIAANGGNIAPGPGVMADQRGYQFSDLRRGDIQMKTKHIFSLILCSILSLSVILAYAAKPTVSAAAASSQDTASTGIALRSGGSWFADESIDGPYMAYMPIVSRLQRVGDKLNTFDSGSQTFPAGSPFHIAHGWLFDSPEEHPELFDFQLQVDGIYREEDFIELKPGESLWYVFNFSAGMSGVHVFTGHWLAPCWAIYEQCTNPDEIVEARSSNVVVTFVP
jgi:hypothetical protein